MLGEAGKLLNSDLASMSAVCFEKDSKKAKKTEKGSRWRIQCQGLERCRAGGMKTTVGRRPVGLSIATLCLKASKARDRG